MWIFCVCFLIFFYSVLVYLCFICSNFIDVFFPLRSSDSSPLIFTVLVSPCGSSLPKQICLQWLDTSYGWTLTSVSCLAWHIFRFISILETACPYCISLIYSFSHASNSVRVKQITFIIPPTPITNFSQIYLPFSYSQIIKLAAVHLWIINSCYFSLKNPFLSCHTRFDIFFYTSCFSSHTFI